MVIKSLQAIIGDKLFKIATIIVSILLVLSLGKGCSTDKKVSAYETELAQWKTQVAELTKQNIEVNQVVDSLRKENIIISSQVIKTTESISISKSNQASLRKKNDSVLAVLRDSLSIACLPAIQLAQQYRNEGDTLLHTIQKLELRDSLRVQNINNLTQANAGLQISNDSLVKLLKTVPVYKPDKILKIFPMPTRTQAFSIGVGAGILATTAIIIAVHK